MCHSPSAPEWVCLLQRALALQSLVTGFPGPYSSTFQVQVLGSQDDA